MISAIKENQNNLAAVNRFDYIDGIKGIGIWLIVLGHSLSPGNLFKAYFYGFHVPIFFSVYGMTYKRPENVGALGRRLIKRTFSYAVTYFIWALIYCNFNFHNVFLLIWGSDESIKAAGSMGTLWFLTSYYFMCLFFEVLMFFISDRKYGELVVGIIFIVLAVCGYYIGKIEISPYRWFWGIDISLVSTLFAYFGYLFQKYLMPAVKTKKAFGALMIIISAGLCFLTFYGGRTTEAGYVQMAVAQYGVFPLFLIVGCSGTLLIAGLSYYITKIKYIKHIAVFIGRQSLIIMVVHREFSYFVRDNIAENTLLYALLALVITCMLACVSYFISSLLPFLAGRYFKTSIKLFGKNIELIK